MRQKVFDGLTVIYFSRLSRPLIASFAYKMESHEETVDFVIYGRWRENPPVLT